MGPIDWLFLALLTGAGVFWIMGAALLLAYRCRRRPAPDSAPVTVLKPLAGKVEGLEPALESFFAQQHPNLQLVFGVGSAGDPAAGVVEALLRKYPKVDAALVVAGETIGPNRKVTNLHYMLPQAKHELLMISDDDVVVPADYVSRMAGEMKDPAVGLASSTYCIRPSSLPLGLHSMSMSTEFFPSVVIAEFLEGGLSFSLGPSTILRRKLLDDIGGLSSLASYLAEDYLIGNLGRAKGWKIKLSREIVGIGDDCRSFGQYFVHQLRWSRTYRACRPGGFFLSILTQGMLFAAGYAATLTPMSPWIAAGFVGLRLACGLVQTASLGSAWILPWLILLPLRDLLSALFWALAFTGSRVRWRGEEFRVVAQGKLERVG